MSVPVPPPPPTRTILATFVGHDRPGITAELFDALGGQVLDIEQVVVRDRLIQAALIGLDDGDDEAAIRAQIGRSAARLGLEVDVAVGGAEAVDHRVRRHLVTVLAAPLCPQAVAGISRRVADAGGNIERIRRTAAYPVTAIALEVGGADPVALRSALAQEAAARQVDVAVQDIGLDLLGQRLVVMDVDSTLIQDEVIELVAAHAGCEAQVAAVTAAAMAGELDFADSLRARVALLAGLPVETLAQVREQVRFTPGARTLCRTLQRLGYHVALVSGGFVEVVEPLAAELHVTLVRANRFEVVDGRLTGRLSGPIVDRAAKAQALRQFAADLGIPLRRTVAIGDGANDLDMLAAAGLGIAFNAKPVVRTAADTSVNVPYLDSVLYLLGLDREAVEAAEADGA
jgi:phosphoserine phosphatase